MESRELRIGVLGAARIVQSALIMPATEVAGVRVVAVSARDAKRAHAFASKHGIEHVRRSYAELLQDPEIDAVYVPLPAALHAEWTIAAIRAGKHVLCEKPFTSNTAAAKRVAAVAAASDKVVMEAYHSHYHPFQSRLREIVHSGELGRIVSARASFAVPIPPGRDIRWNLRLGGGGLLDVGYYPVRLLRELFGDAREILQARAWERDGVDRLITGVLRFDQGIEGEFVSSIWSRRLMAMGLEIHGEDGRIAVTLPYHPHMGAKARINSGAGRRVERAGRKSTYTYQLEAFRDASLHGAAVPTDSSAAVSQIETLDSIYATAGMSARP